LKVLILLLLWLKHATVLFFAVKRRTFMEIAKGQRALFLAAEVVRLGVPAARALIVNKIMALRFYIITVAGGWTAIAQEDAHMLVTFASLVPV
jgi:hypothetical protein